MSEYATIEAKFSGPPESGNGGYVCGVVAGLIGGTAEVTLRKPPPLDRPLEVLRRDGDAVVLRHGDEVVAEGAAANFDLDVPEPPAYKEAEEASKAYAGFRQHVFPSCFVCGPERREGEGLRIFPARISGREIVAAPWTPDASLASAAGPVRPEFVWAALDCPGAWGLPDLPDGRPVVLGRLAAQLLEPVQPGERMVVIGWPLGEEGRKVYSGTALFNEGGSIRAFARATWIRLAER